MKIDIMESPSQRLWVISETGVDGQTWVKYVAAKLATTADEAINKLPKTYLQRNRNYLRAEAMTTGQWNQILGDLKQQLELIQGNIKALSNPS